MFAYRNEIINSVKTNPTTIIVGETGSGKTTQIAQYLLDSGLFRSMIGDPFSCRDGVIGITQPRRVAAITVAKRVSEERGTRIGEEVGYSVRFDECCSANTSIKFLTDGMLLREAMIDQALSRYVSLLLIAQIQRANH